MINKNEANKGLIDKINEVEQEYGKTFQIHKRFC